MSRWASAFRIAAVAVGAFFAPGSWAANWHWIAAQAESERQRRKRDKANNRARAAFNESQKDRLEMLDLTPDQPRTLCLGRVRYVEGVRRRWTSGTHSEKLTMLVSFAGHEIDAFESFYANDQLLTFDGSDWAQEEPYRTVREEVAQDSGTLNGSGGGSVVLTYTPVTGSVTAQWYTGVGDSYESGAVNVDSVVGTTVTLSGGRASASVQVNYRREVETEYLRIRGDYLGTATQNIGDDLDAEYPGKITSTDEGAGIACAVVDLIYSPDVYPQGPPNITAVFRGAKCYDPRLDSTVDGGSGAHRIHDESTWAWSENPALCALRYAMWSSGLRLSYGAGITDTTLADVIAAADQCDISTDFDLLMPDTSTDTVTLPRHRCGITIPADADKRQAMDSIVDTMAGEWAFDGPELRLRAGVKATAVAAITQDWLVEDASSETAEPAVTATQSISREQRANRITGSCVDPSERYQMLPYPAVSDATLISAKGERREEIDYPGVNHIAHAQHLASIEIRRRQAGQVVQLSCDARAELLQLFDVVTFTLPSWGVTTKDYEVIGTDFAATGPNGVMLREISDAIFTVDATLDGRDPAPDSSLRAPWDVGTLGTITVASGTTALLDSSIVGKALVSWPAVTGEWIRKGGRIEIQYTRADESLPSGDWESWVVEGTATSTIIAPLKPGRPYLFRGRLVQPMPLVRGAWSGPVVHLMAVVSSVLGTMGGGNLLPNSSFAVDSNADGYADGWLTFSSGTTGALTATTPNEGVLGGKCQRIDAAGLGTSPGNDRFGIYYPGLALNGLAGRPLTVSAWFSASAQIDMVMRLTWKTSGGSTISTSDFTTDNQTSAALRRVSGSAVVPATCTQADVYFWVTPQAGRSAGACSALWDDVQLEVGAVPTAYAPRADELLAGVVGTTNLASGAATDVSTNSAAGPFSVTTGVGWTVARPASPEASVTVTLDGTEKAVIVTVEGTWYWSYTFGSASQVFYNEQIAVRHSGANYAVRDVQIAVSGPTASTYVGQGQFSTTHTFTGLSAGSKTFGLEWIEGSGGGTLADGNPRLDNIKTKVEVIKR